MSEEIRGASKALANPFVKDRYHLSLLSITRYPSTETCRVVWAKGRASEVPPAGTRRWCPRWRYDTVVFVWMDARRLPAIRLDGLMTRDDIPISCTLELIAKPNQHDNAIRDIALHYEDKIDVLRVITRQLLAMAFRKLKLEEARSRHTGKSEVLRTELNERSTDLTLPFMIVDASVELEETPLEKASQDRLRGALAHEAQRGALAGRQELELLEAEGQLVLLKELHRQRTLEREQDTAVASVRSNIERQHIETMRMLEELSPSVLIAAHRDFPEVAQALTGLEAAKIAHDDEALTRAFDQVTSLLAAVTRSAGNLVQQPPAISVSQSR